MGFSASWLKLAPDATCRFQNRRSRTPSQQQRQLSPPAVRLTTMLGPSQSWTPRTSFSRWPLHASSQSCDAVNSSASMTHLSEKCAVTVPAGPEGGEARQGSRVRPQLCVLGPDGRTLPACIRIISVKKSLGRMVAAELTQIPIPLSALSTACRSVDGQAFTIMNCEVSRLGDGL